MNLHRVQNHTADWDIIDPAERNGWQQLAADTHGIVTPGNIVTLTGGILVISGLLDIRRGNRLRGALQLGAGSLMDIADGYVADKTQTKSPLGEAFDASSDKLALLATMIILVNEKIMPLKMAALITIQNSANAVAGAIAVHGGREIHTTREGKLSVLGQRICTGLYTLGAVARERHWSAAAVTLERSAALLGTCITIGPGLTATAQYYNDALLS